MNLVIINSNFITSSQQFNKGEVYCFFATQDNPEDLSTWIRVTNRGFEFSAAVPRDHVTILPEAEFQRLTEAGLLVGTIDRTQNVPVQQPTAWEDL